MNQRGLCLQVKQRTQRSQRYERFEPSMTSICTGRIVYSICALHFVSVVSSPCSGIVCSLYYDRCASASMVLFGVAEERRQPSSAAEHILGDPLGEFFFVFCQIN